jgi:hypothetical protein
MLRTTSRTISYLGPFFAALLWAATGAAEEPIDASPRPQSSGFALQASVVTSTTVIDDDLISFQLGTFEGGLTFGYKYNRVVIGVGFDFTNLSESRTIEDFDPMTGNVTGNVRITEDHYSFVVYPEVQVALAQSADKRAELTGTFSIGFGTWGTRETSSSSSPQPTPEDNDTELRLRWRVGPGVRYWVHPNIGMSVVSGVVGNHLFVIADDDADSRSIGVTSLYAQAGLLGVF